MLNSLHVQLLDHGYLSFVESWGSDERIIESARMSTGKGFQGWGSASAKLHRPGQDTKRVVLSDAESAEWIKAGRPSGVWLTAMQSRASNGCQYSDVEYRPGDEKLLSYLYKNRHSTPFEFAGLTIELMCPLAVLRQWHRHRTQSYNEMSARYMPIPNVHYLPDAARCIVVPGKNKQARGIAERVPTHDEVLGWLAQLEAAYAMSDAVYQHGLNIGIPKEVARMPVAVGRYSVMRATANLRNWLGFLTLRSDPHAQLEIRVYAEAVGKILEAKFPRTMALFNASRE